MIQKIIDINVAHMLLSKKKMTLFVFKNYIYMVLTIQRYLVSEKSQLKWIHLKREPEFHSK